MQTDELRTKYDELIEAGMKERHFSRKQSLLMEADKLRKQIKQLEESNDGKRTIQ